MSEGRPFDMGNPSRKEEKVVQRLIVVVLNVCLVGGVLAAEVTVDVGLPEVMQHVRTNVHIQIVNHMQAPVLLERVRIEPDGAASDWRREVLGSIRYDEATNTFSHNRMAQMASVLRRSAALLIPGAGANVAVPLLVTETGPAELTAVVSYHVIASEEMAGCIYLPAESSPLAATFTPATLKRLSDAPSPGEIGAPVFEFATRNLPEAKEARAKAAFEVKATQFPLEEAMGQVRVVRHEYDRATGTWLLDTETGMWAVTGKSVLFYPAMGAEEYHFVGGSRDSVRFWVLPESLPEGVVSEVQELVAKFEPEEAMGLHFQVPAKEVPALGASLTRLGLRLLLSNFQLTPVLSIREIKH